ncbi:MAG: acyl-CoA thioesterase [Cytophagales bacterium]|nr:MAG: acyl-CoA thioesterase [Cytophagales bacterium]
MTLQINSFSHSLRVRWAEVDAQQVVFNGHYLTYFDIAITEYMRSVGIIYPNGLTPFGVDWYVRKATVEYHLSAHFDDWLQMAVERPTMGNSSLTFKVFIYRDDTLLVSGEVVYVNVDLNTKKPMTIPEAVRQLFNT